MWSGVDPDVQLFASGNVLDDDGEWAGGQALAADAPPGEDPRSPDLRKRCRRKYLARRQLLNAKNSAIVSLC